MAAAAAATAAGGAAGLARLIETGDGEASSTRRYGDLRLRRGKAASDAPNVLFIILDDCNDWLGFLNNHPGTYTPNLDALAATSLLFDKAYCPRRCACPPAPRFSSAGSRITPGSTTTVTRARQNYRQLTAVTPSLVDDIWAAGYDAIGAGKVFHDNPASRWTQFLATVHYWTGFLRKDPAAPADSYEQAGFHRTMAHRSAVARTSLHDDRLRTERPEPGRRTRR